MVRGLVVAVAFIVVTFHLFPTGSLQAQPASPPASAAAPAPHKVELLFVQNALSGSFDGKTLTLKGVGPTLFFSDRPDRVTGHLGTAEFVGHWDKGADSFAKNPPNATLSILGEKGVNLHSRGPGGGCTSLGSARSTKRRDGYSSCSTRWAATTGSSSSRRGARLIARRDRGDHPMDEVSGGPLISTPASPSRAEELCPRTAS
jgi:hypothetical protein